MGGERRRSPEAVARAMRRIDWTSLAEHATDALEWALEAGFVEPCGVDEDGSAAFRLTDEGLRYAERAIDQINAVDN